MNIKEFAETIMMMPVEKQNEFFEVLKGELPEEDWLATVNWVSVYSMFRNPAKYKAMGNAIKAVLVEDIFGHEYDETDYYGAKSLRGFEDFERTGYYMSCPGIHK